ncbi:MAG: NADPH-dependent 2,4-dienoyl-CoA reductase, partial [Saprospiraceae bacterium]
HRGGLNLAQPELPERQVYLLKRSTGKHGNTLGKTTGWIHKANLQKNGVKMLSDVEYIKVDNQGLSINVSGSPMLLEVDHIVVCAGQESSRSLYEALLSKGLSPKLIGGAFEAAELDAKSAIHQACTLAAEV